MMGREATPVPLSYRIHQENKTNGSSRPEHAWALRDQSDRVEVVHAYSPTAAPRIALGRNFDFPLTERCEGRDVCQSIAIRARRIVKKMASIPSTPTCRRRDFASRQRHRFRAASTRRPRATPPLHCRARGRCSRKPATLCRQPPSIHKPCGRDDVLASTSVRALSTDWQSEAATDISSDGSLLTILTRCDSLKLSRSN